MGDILMFSTADWDNNVWTNKQHTAVLFAERGYRVLYVDSLGLRRPTLNARDLKRICRRIGKCLPLARRVHPDVWRISPLVLPLHGSERARRINAGLLHGLIARNLARLRMERPLIWTYNPVIADLCASLPHSGIVYHCVDDLRAAPHIDPAAIEEGEARLGRAADLCFTTSALLRDRMRTLFTRVAYEPNVCDRDFFATARQPLPVPPELRNIPRPRLLFVGAVSAYKVDFPLLETLARRMPEAHFLLVGPVGEGQPDGAPPPKLPNIHLAGAVPYGRLPYFMAHADAALLPVPHNAYTAAMFPMKFFEYLAAGLPLVGTRLPALAEFEHLYFPSDNEEDFLVNLRRVLAGERR
ncbi:MAG: glycosyltransferase, partial [Desulfovibrio sp.]|nr:glycosyltransferase [Desulfovibrio sp.]